MLSTDKQTDKQTDKLANATKNITSFAKEVINVTHMHNTVQDAERSKQTNVRDTLRTIETNGTTGKEDLKLAPGLKAEISKERLSTEELHWDLT